MESGNLVSDEDMVDSANALVIGNSSHNSANSLSESWIQSTDQANMFETFERLPGLKLSKTPSFLDKLDQLAQRQEQGNSSSGYDHMVQAQSGDLTIQHATKMKAENFPISLLRIGSWKRETRNEGDLVAKCYFAKRKLVWEFLEGGLKSKVEIQWSDIMSFKAVMLEDQPSILKLELKQPPSFYHELDPQPRKHTQWKVVPDFTGGEALNIRRHHLEFPPGALERPLDKLLRCDSRLSQLSRQGFPTLESPYFEEPSFSYGNHAYSFGFGGQVGHANVLDQPQQFSFSNSAPAAAAHYLSDHQRFLTYNDQQIADKYLSFQNSEDSPLSDNQSNVRVFSQGMMHNNVRDSLVINQVGGMPLAAAASSTPRVMMNSSTSISRQNNQMSSFYVQEAMNNQLAMVNAATPPSTSHHLQYPTLSSFQDAASFQEADQRHLQSRFQMPNYNNDQQQNAVLMNNLQADQFSNNAMQDQYYHDNLYRDQGHVTNYTSNVTDPNYGGLQNMGDSMGVMSNNFPSSYVDGSTFTQVGSWPPVSMQAQSYHQVPYETNLLLSVNNSVYNNSSDNSDPTTSSYNNSSANSDPIGYFPNFNQNDWM